MKRPDVQGIRRGRRAGLAAAVWVAAAGHAAASPRVVDSEALRATESGEVAGLAALEDKVYFTAQEVDNRFLRHLWVGEKEGPLGLHKVAARMASDVKVACGGAIYFWSEGDIWSARDGQVHRVMDLDWGEQWDPHSDNRTVGCDEEGGRFFFRYAPRSGEPNSLWVSEGTPETTRELFEFPSKVSLPIRFFNGPDGRVILHTDVTNVDQEALWEVSPPYQAPKLLVVGQDLEVQGFLPSGFLFTSREATGTHSLSFFPFAEPGARVLLEPSAGDPALYAGFRRVGDHAYFTAAAPRAGGRSRDLWMTDGCPEGTQALTDNPSQRRRTEIVGAAGPYLLVRDSSLTGDDAAYFDVRDTALTPVQWAYPQGRVTDGSVIEGKEFLLFNVMEDGQEKTIVVQAADEATSGSSLKDMVMPSPKDRGGNASVAIADDGVWFAAPHPLLGKEIWFLDLDGDEARVRLLGDVNVTTERVGYHLLSQRKGDLIYRGERPEGGPFLAVYSPGDGVQHYPAPDLLVDAASLTSVPEHGGCYFTTFSQLWFWDYTGDAEPKMVDDAAPFDIVANGGARNRPFVVVNGYLLYLKENAGRWTLFSLASPEAHPVPLLHDIAELPGPFAVGDRAYVVRPGKALNQIWEVEGPWEAKRLVYEEPEANETRLQIHGARPDFLAVFGYFGSGKGPRFLDLKSGEMIDAVVEGDKLRGRFHVYTLDSGMLVQGVADGESLRSLWYASFDDASVDRLVYPAGVSFVAPAEKGNAVSMENRHFFVATSADHGRELWQVEGLTLTRLTDLQSGPEDGVAHAELVAWPEGRAFFFVGNDGERGEELYRYDLDRAEHQLAADLRKGPASSRPRDLRIHGNELLFWAQSDLQAGMTLHALPLAGGVVSTPPSLDWVKRGGQRALRLRGGEGASLYESRDLRVWVPVPDITLTGAEAESLYWPPRTDPGAIFYRLGPPAP